MIIDAGRADVGMAEPFLHFRDVGAGIEGISRGRRATGLWKW